MLVSPEGPLAHGPFTRPAVLISLWPLQEPPHNLALVEAILHPPPAGEGQGPGGGGALHIFANIFWGVWGKGQRSQLHLMAGVPGPQPVELRSLLPTHTPLTWATVPHLLYDSRKDFQARTSVYPSEQRWGEP